MKYSHVLITRPREEAEDLANLLAHSGAQTIILPAFTFSALRLGSGEARELQKAALESVPPLLVFTSPRSVEFGLGQVPPVVLENADIAAIGPTTAALLEARGMRVDLRPGRAYTSEALLETIAARQRTAANAPGSAYLFASPGGRTRLLEGLVELRFKAKFLMVYERRPAELPAEAIDQIERAQTLLAIWSSANTLEAMHQRLPGECWNRLCQAEWLVVSDRLRRAAHAYGPRRVHLAAGPTNREIFQTVQSLA